MVLLQSMILSLFFIVSYSSGIIFITLDIRKASTYISVKFCSNVKFNLTLKGTLTSINCLNIKIGQKIWNIFSILNMDTFFTIYMRFNERNLKNWIDKLLYVITLETWSNSAVFRQNHFKGFPYNSIEFEALKQKLFNLCSKSCVFN